MEVINLFGGFFKGDKMISANPEHEKFKFPCGELHVRLKQPLTSTEGTIHFQYENNEEIIELLLLADAMKRQGIKVQKLIMPYVPFSRQDRVMNEGETFSLAVFANLINSINADVVYITDPHSDVTPALINNVVINPQHNIFWGHLRNQDKKFWLISPDGGALKKIYKLAQALGGVDVIECTKIRETKTGKILGTTVHSNNLEGRDCFIIDDICDGGRTFIEIAKRLKELNAGKVTLYVSHGFFTKGLSGVFDDLIDEIYTMKGRVK